MVETGQGGVVFHVDLDLGKDNTPRGGARFVCLTRAAHAIKQRHADDLLRCDVHVGGNVVGDSPFERVRVRNRQAGSLAA